MNGVREGRGGTFYVPVVEEDMNEALLEPLESNYDDVKVMTFGTTAVG